MAIQYTLIIAIACIGVGFAIAKFFTGSQTSNWSNKELDGTVFISAILTAFLMMIVMTYTKPEFADAPTSVKIMEIIKDVFLIIVGYLFKKSADNEKQKSERAGGGT